MPTEKDLLSLLLTSGVVHPWGHVGRASEYGIPASVNYGDLTENWKYAGDPRVDAALHGAGFDTQDRVKSMMTGADRDSMAKANALYKGLYLAGGPSILGAKTGYKKGDIEGIKNASGNKYVGPMLGASAIADALDAYNIIPENHGLSFRMDEGTPSLMYNYRW